jgi:hypothetical protein
MKTIVNRDSFLISYTISISSEQYFWEQNFLILLIASMFQPFRSNFIDSINNVTYTRRVFYDIQLLSHQGISNTFSIKQVQAAKTSTKDKLFLDA